MSSEQIDAYLAKLGEPQRSTLTELRATIREIVPEAEEIISYNMPAFRMRGKVIAGFAAFKQHVSYFPHSGSVIPALKKQLQGYETSSGTLRFAPDSSLPRALVEKLISVRMEQAFGAKPHKD
jgi:uncharacterized protein YdhG (YjbR/CyaY superfamily)